MAEATHKVHGVEFVRSGLCNQCDGCDPDCLDCPHGEKREDGKVYCKIQDSKTEVCDHCTNNPDSKWYKNGEKITHQVCEDFPNHPWLKVIKSGKCNYKFEVVKKDEAKLTALNDKWR